MRHDQYNYYPSDNPFADLGPVNLQRETVSQLRFLTNAGARASVSYVKGIHNIKAGITYEHTFLTENDHLGIVDPTLNAPCLTPATVQRIRVRPSPDSPILPSARQGTSRTCREPCSPAQLGSALSNFNPILLPST